jgi:hypothetical protein
MVRIVCDAVNAVVGGAGDDVRKMIQDMLSYQVEEGAYSPYGGGGWQVRRPCSHGAPTPSRLDSRVPSPTT